MTEDDRTFADPELADFMATLATMPPMAASGDVAELRRATAERSAQRPPGPAMPTESIRVGATDTRLYRPDGADDGIVVYFHGGGWTIGDLDTHDVLCRELSNGSGAVVVAVDYRMAPEHRFPAAVDDACAATAWVRREANELGIDASRLAVGGDSAGGNLAAVVAIAARDAGDLPIAYQLLIYPATDMRRGHPSHSANGSGYLLTTETISYYHDHYVADAAHDLDWRASPLLHPDLSRLPPATARPTSASSGRSTASSRWAR
jgi:acetyl esterase/lipase